MIVVVLDQRHRVIDLRPVRRQHPSGLQLQDLLKAGQILGQAATAADGNHDSSTLHQEIPAEQGAAGLLEEAQVVWRVAGRVNGPERRVAGRDLAGLRYRSPPDRIASVAVRPGFLEELGVGPPLGDRPAASCVIGVSVRHEHSRERDGAERLSERVQMTRVAGCRIDQRRVLPGNEIRIVSSSRIRAWVETGNQRDVHDGEAGTVQMVDDWPSARQLYRVPPTASVSETFTSEERTALAPYFGNVDTPVFVLTNLPEVVKGALFARYSRSAKSVRRLFLDEFLGHVPPQESSDSAVGVERAERLYARVFSEYGDDSVAQLGGAHIACEGVSNVLTKVLERGRLMAYLEQSTRYVPYTDRPGGQWKYVTPDEVAHEGLRTTFTTGLDRAFETYARWLEPLQDHFRQLYPKSADDTEGVYKAAIRAKALDALRGLLPAATRANVGIYGSGQAYETLLLNMRANALAETREVADRMLPELRKVIPAFLSRVDLENRGVRWTSYLAARRADTEATAAALLGEIEAEPRPDVTLADFDPDGEIKVVAAALYAASHLPKDQLVSIARAMPVDDRVRVLRAYIGDRVNRRHRPGRAFERTSYCFDILSDYGAFRDLQRHRMLSIDWQQLTPSHGYTQSAAIDDVGATADWRRVMDESAELHERLATEHSSQLAQYAVSMAYRIRFYLDMNAREAMHVIELRTAPQGHPAYRRVCQLMHRLIADQAGHKAIAEAMTFADHSEVELERLKAERATERRRRAR